MFIGRIAHSPNGLFEAAVVMNGVWQPLYRRPQDDQLFVAGEPGEAFRLRVYRAGDPKRIEVIVAVDGRNILSDESGDERKNRGTLINQSYYFDEWRLNNESRRFTFGDTGHDGNAGVIGFAAYREGSAASEAEAPQAANLFGSPSGPDGFMLGALPHTTPFVRAGDPDIVVIRYDTKERLRARGIWGPIEPPAFPGIPDGTSSSI